MGVDGSDEAGALDGDWSAAVVDAGGDIDA